MVLWKFLTLLAVGLALLWETRPAYALAYLSVLLFFAFQSGQKRLAAKIEVVRPLEEHFLFPGDQRAITLQVINPTLWPFAWISLADRIPRNLMTGQHAQRPVFSLSPRGSHDVSFQLTAHDRGVYRLGPLDLFVGDFFGIRTQKYQVQKGQTVVVYPRIHELGDLNLPSRLTFGSFQALQRMNPDPTRLAGLRRYQMGDPLRTIHWPATARTQSLQVKQFDHTVTATCVLFLNLYSEDYSVARFYVDTETAIAVAASLANHVIRRGESCGLVSNDVLAQHLPGDMATSQGEGIVQLRARQGTGQLTQILTILAGVNTQDQKDFPSLLTECGHQLEGAAVLLWVVPRDTPDIVEHAWGFANRGRQVLIFVVEEVRHQELLWRPPGSSLQVFAVAKGGTLGL